MSRTEDSQGRPAVLLVLDDAGGERMRALTGPNVGNSMAIVLDGEVLRAPTLRSTMADRAQIAGSFSEEEIDRIMTQLQQGVATEDAP